jgi:hypothetical protein
MRELANRFENARLIAASSVQLGSIAARQGRLNEARAQLDNAVEQGLAVHSTRNVTLSLAAFAAVALAEGDAERAALLLGAADGLRRRAGLRPWPDAPRRAGGDIVVRIREKLGAERFSHALAAGGRLNQRDAVVRRNVFSCWGRVPHQAGPSSADTTGKLPMAPGDQVVDPTAPQEVDRHSLPPPRCQDPQPLDSAQPPLNGRNRGRACREAGTARVMFIDTIEGRT